MSQLTAEKRLEIKSLVEDFVASTLGTECPNGNCFTACYPLSIHLTHNRIENYISWGHYNKHPRPHYWLNLIEYQEAVVDPTIRQFERDTDAVIVVEKSESYESKPYENSLLSPLDKPYGIIDRWIDRLLNDGSSTYDLDIPTPKLDINVMLRINLNAAIILDKEIEPEERTEDVRKYFAYIYKIVIKNLERIENLNPPLPEGVSDLISRAKDYSSVA